MIKWSKLTMEEIDRLVHTKVMGGSIGRCEGTAYYTGRIGEDEWYCETCKKFYYDIEEGGMHDAPIPSYSTDMNAAMSALLHLGKRFQLVYYPARNHSKFACFIDANSSSKVDAIGVSNEIIEAINFAVLKDCGVEIEP